MAEFVSGLDLAQAADFTALAILEKIGETPAAYQVRHLERFPLGTSYVEIVERVDDIFRRNELADTTLAVDQTGVGRAVLDMITQRGVRAAITPVTITAGHKATKAEDGWHVPKKDLVSVLQVALQSGRLKIASGLRHAKLLTKELATFRVKITAAANETFEAWREGDHDDLVLAVGLAVWAGERFFTGPWIVDPEALRAGRSIVDRAPEGVFLKSDQDGRRRDGMRPVW
jgi:hypothetical protein